MVQHRVSNTRIICSHDQRRIRCRRQHFIRRRRLRRCHLSIQYRRPIPRMQKTREHSRPIFTHRHRRRIQPLHRHLLQQRPRHRIINPNLIVARTGHKGFPIRKHHIRRLIPRGQHRCHLPTRQSNHAHRIRHLIDHPGLIIGPRSHRHRLQAHRNLRHPHGHRIRHIKHTQRRSLRMNRQQPRGIRRQVGGMGVPRFKPGILRLPHRLDRR